MAAVFTYSPSTLIVGRHGNHSDAGAHDCASRISCLEVTCVRTVIHFLHRLPFLQSMLVVSSIRTGSADGGKTIVGLFCCCFMSCPGCTQPILVCVTQRFLGLFHTSAALECFSLKGLCVDLYQWISTEIGKIGTFKCHVNSVTVFSFSHRRHWAYLTLKSCCHSSLFIHICCVLSQSPWM